MQLPSYQTRFLYPRQLVVHRYSPLRLIHQPAALKKLFQDISDHSDLTEQRDNPSSQSHTLSQRRSDASQYGSTRMPIVTLPPDLIAGVQDLVQSVDHRSTIRTSALGLYGKYRLTSSKQSLNQSNHDLIDSYLSDPKTQLEKNNNIKPKLATTYDHLTSISFAAGAMPSHYGATLKVLQELKRKANSDQFRRGLEAEWTPKALLDYGSGTGSAIWSALQVWPETINKYTALDKSRSMIWLNQKLLESRSHHTPSSPMQTRPSGLVTRFKTITISPTEAQKLHQHKVPEDYLMQQVEALDSQKSSNLEIDLQPPREDWIGDSDGLLAIMSFTLTDLPNQAARRQAVEGMWDSGAETMVIIDRGTPAGFQVIAEARQQLLMLGRRAVRNSSRKKDPSKQATLDSASCFASTEEDVDEGQAADSESMEKTDEGDQHLGSWVLAPCPHDKACPLHLSDNPQHFCHFSQRIERPQFLKLTKHTSKQEEDAKYSYVIIRRGRRAPPSTIASPPLSSGSPDLSKQKIEDKQKTTQFSKGDALEWPRIILPPHKCKGHVVFDVCAMSGHIERMTIPKSQGKQAYYDARKTFWGDTWPHGSKKPGLIKTLQGRNGNRGDRRRKKKELNSRSD